jgi:hypothetical protein
MTIRNWFIACLRLLQVILRSLTLLGLVVFVALMGATLMVPIELSTGMSMPIGYLLGPALGALATTMVGTLACHMAGTTLIRVLVQYVFIEATPTPSNDPGEPRWQFFAIVLGVLCPWLGLELVIMLTGSLAQSSLPVWVMNGARLLVVIGGGVDAVRLVLRRYPRVFTDDPIVRRLVGRTKRK